MSLKPFIAAAFLAAMTQVAIAQEAKSIGAMKGTFDSEAATWSTIEMTDGKETDASARLSGSNFLLQGYTQAGDTLTVEIAAVDSLKLGAAHNELEISYFPVGAKGQFWTSDGVAKQRATIRFTTLTQTGKKGRAEGEFSGLLCKMINASTDIDQAECKGIQATFATDLLIEE